MPVPHHSDEGKEKRGLLPVDFDRDLLDHMLEGCQIISNDWRYIYLNDAVLKMAHKTRDELLGHSRWKCTPGLKPPPFFAP